MTPEELYEEADALDAEANKIHQAALDYLDDVEHECSDMNSEADKLRAMAAEMKAKEFKNYES